MTHTLACAVDDAIGRCTYRNCTSPAAAAITSDAHGVRVAWDATTGPLTRHVYCKPHTATMLCGLVSAMVNGAALDWTILTSAAPTQGAA